MKSTKKTNEVNLKEISKLRPATLTQGSRVGKSKLLSDEELYYYLNSCPFFQTYRDGEVERVERALLPLFRYYHYRKLNDTHVSFGKWVSIMGKYFNSGDNDYGDIYKKLERYFTNYYALFHPSKKFKVITPFFPYKHDAVMGCSEVVMETKSGVRIYTYNFSDTGVGPEELNYHGFKLQLAARIFHIKTGIEAGSMACVYPASKTAVYYTYNPEEKLEEFIKTPPTPVRRYGSHCSICMQRFCVPLIDRTDKYGWKTSERT